MGRGGGRSAGGSSHSSSRGVTSGRGSGGSRSRGSGTHRGGGMASGSGHSNAPRRDYGYSRPPRGGYGGPVVPPRRTWYGGYRPRPTYGGPVYQGGYSGGGFGCGGLIVSIILILLVLTLLMAFAPAACSVGLTSCSSNNGVNNMSSNQITQVSHTHEKLAASECDESSEWLDDQAGWIDSQNTVVSAMRYFYNKTGSQPFLVIATNVNGKTDFTDDEAEIWVNDIYDQHFSDDGHTVVAFVEYSESEYAYYIVAGRSAQSVIDEEAREIIADEINYWYTDTSLDDSEYFAKVFTESADAIMFEYEETTKTSNASKRTIVIALGAAGAVAVIGYVIARTSKRKKEEYEEARKLAETPVGSATAGTTSSTDAAASGDAASSTLSELEEFERKYGSD